MTKVQIVLFLSTLTAALSIVCATGDGASTSVPTFELNDLLTGRRSDEFSTVLGTTGLLAVRIAHAHRETALNGLCTCQDRILTIEGTDKAILQDSTTLRTTLATATAGQTPLPLPNSLGQVCGQDVAHAMDGLRDDVSTVTDAFIVALDRLLGGASQELLRNSHNGVYTSISSIQESANHLEHFHVYSKQKQNNEGKSHSGDGAELPRALNKDEDKTLFWHTDAGLFLAFVPALNCKNGGAEADNSFWMDDKAVAFPADSVVIMLGAGAEHWLRTPVPLKATRHAVRMQPGQMRAWYGMMFLVPDNAVVQENPQRTFGDMQKAVSSLSDTQGHDFKYRGGGDNAHVSIGCGRVSEYAYGENLQQQTHRHRRRLQHVQDPSQCNNNTNFFCWMSCLDIPQPESIDEFLDDGYSLYCLDPAILASSGNSVSQAVAPCGYGNHNSRCMGKWTRTAPSVPGYDLHRNSTNVLEEQFCYGGTSMYMDGFHWTDTTCVIFLFPEWILSSKGRLAIASIGTFIGAGILEFVIFQRRQAVGSAVPGLRRLSLSALFYGLQLTLGYFLMLVIMTYSGPLFMCTVLGLVCGHVFFNSKDAVLAPQQKPTTVVNVDEDTNPTNSDSPQGYAGVPEGITPCCQNDLA